MKQYNYFLFVIGMAFVLSGCAISRSERIITLNDTEQNRPVQNKVVIFVECWDATFLPVDAPLFGGHDEIVQVPLDANGQAHVRLRKVRWWARVDMDGSRSGNCGTSIKPSDIRDGGAFRLFASPPSPYDTNLYPSKFVLTISRP